MRKQPRGTATTAAILLAGATALTAGTLTTSVAASASTVRPASYRMARTRRLAYRSAPSAPAAARWRWLNAQRHAADVAAAAAAPEASPAPATSSVDDSFSRLRQCESGSDYGISTGNGYFGAYQFSARTWHSLGYGGLPSDATSATQDEAAHRLQAAYGWGQWPSCSRQLGLR